MNTKKSSIHGITTVGILTALICIMGPLSIPIGIIPISMTNFAIYFAVIILGWKKGTLSYLIYLMIGLVGLPVFSGFTGGAGKLFGPTGGYLAGFILMAVIGGFIAEKCHGKWYISIAGMGIGTIAAYGFGSLWLSYQASINFSAALAAGVIPFIPGDLLKIVVAVFLGNMIKVKLMKAHLI